MGLICPQAAIRYSGQAETTEPINFQSFISAYLLTNYEEFLLSPAADEKAISEDFTAMVKPHNERYNRKYGI